MKRVRADDSHAHPRGRKPLDPALPREVLRHEQPESERVCPHDEREAIVYGTPHAASFITPASIA
jgi:hypothetical protein